MINSPQPKPGNGGGNYEVVVRGLVKEDGHVYSAVVQSSEREDLNSEALAIASQWSFTAGMCDGRPNQDEVEIKLHFVNR
jgi:TonB family protein